VRWEVLAPGDTSGVVQGQEIMTLKARLVGRAVPTVNQQCQMESSIQSSRKNQVHSVAVLVRGTFLSMD
jgi:hypothetical protein